MQYVFLDDSVSYDGYSPDRRPLGGAEKAVVSLATALADRGHDVKVLNNTTYGHTGFRVHYSPLENIGITRGADVVIAMRKPSLLGTVRSAKHRILWVPGAPDYLSAPANAPLWDSFQPTFLFVDAAQKRAYTGPVRNVLLAPGTRPTFQRRTMLPAVVEADPSASAAVAAPAEPAASVIPPPHAIVTTHPLHGLAGVIDLWTKYIHPQLNDARLSVYSAVLTKGLKGEAIPAELVPVLEKVKAAAGANVVVVEPRHDDGMAADYLLSRVHLYPGHAQDYACWTLQESQASGLPAVARPLGGVNQRIDNGQTGYIVPDDAAFANVALEILRNDEVYKNLSAAACAPARQRPWEMVAAELEAHIAEL